MKTLLLLLAFLTMNVPEPSLNIGDAVPDIVMTGLDGKTLKLSSLKGKVVLVDFWASWCKPCRKENPEIVRVYDKYKDELFENGNGFTVFSVSLDSKQVAWEKAIRTDSLPWKYHVSDLKGWKNEAARTYSITSIPQSYLIDGDGEIIAVNPRGSRLEKELKKFKESNFSFFRFFFSD